MLPETEIIILYMYLVVGIIILNFAAAIVFFRYFFLPFDLAPFGAQLPEQESRLWARPAGRPALFMAAGSPSIWVNRRKDWQLGLILIPESKELYKQNWSVDLV